MSALSISLPLRRGKRRLKSSASDLLCPELMDNIVERVARDSPSSLTQLARVDRAFRDATRRCSQTLVIWRPLQRGEEQRRAARVCKEMSLRPKLSKLVVKIGDTNKVNAGLWKAVSTFQWTSIVNNMSRERCVKFFSSSRSSLRSSTVIFRHVTCQPRGEPDIRPLVQAFPKLEELTVRGYEYRRESNSLTSLDLSLGLILWKSPEWQETSRT
jgi:hypothetical protein